MIKNRNRYTCIGMAAAVLAYVLVIWGLLLLALYLRKNVPAFYQLGILSWEMLFTVALASLLPVFVAEHRLCGSFAVPWILVRLITPCAGFILLLLTLAGFFPVVFQNLFILFPAAGFVLIQGGLLLLSICFTAIRRRIRKSREREMGQDFISDPKLRPIQMPPKMEQGMTRDVHTSPRVRTRKRDWKSWKSTISAAVMVAAIIGGMGVMLRWFPSYQIALLFWPEVTQADVMSPGYWNGRRAAEDIPRLTSLSQLEDGTYDGLTYLTVETENLIPLSYYKLKDSTDSRVTGWNGTAQSRGGRAPLPLYAHFAGVNAMYYGQYCVVELEDGSFIGAFLDSSYTTAFGKVQLPVGKVVSAGSQEAQVLREAAVTYAIPADRLLLMHSDSYDDDIKLLDQAIRLIGIMLVPAVILGGWILVWLIRRKKKK